MRNQVISLLEKLVTSIFLASTKSVVEKSIVILDELKDLESKWEQM